MEKRMMREGQMFCFALFLLCLFLVGGIERVEAYKNYTVGDSQGWYDNLVKPGVDYGKWVSGKTFSLGDFLIFNTDSNHTVIQTHKSGTYNACDSRGDDNIEWSNIQPNSTDVRPITVPVPLLKEGPTYFFSGDYDGEQCMHGQKFEINVTYGQGLPPSFLRDNPDLANAVGPTSSNTALSPGNPDAGSDDSTPDIVSSNYDFSHPKKVPSEDDSSDEGSESTKTKSNEARFVGGSGVLLGSLTWGILGLLI